MRPFLLIVLSVLSATYAAAAEPAAAEKDTLIDRIEVQTYGQFKFSSDSPIVGMMLQSPKQANPEAKADVWQTVATEVAAGYLEIMTRKGGMMDQLLRPALGAMTTPELKRLSVILADPVYEKYKTSMQDPDMQRSIQKTMMDAAMQIGPMLNQILAKHGLHEVH